MRGGALRGGRFEVRTATMVDLISMAYGMESDKVLAGPSWLDWDRFDVAAKAPAATTRENLNPMVRKLLAELFQLVVHKEGIFSPQANAVGSIVQEITTAPTGGKPLTSTSVTTSAVTVTFTG
jgi:Protein of unknown function (DUF3738)